MNELLVGKWIDYPPSKVVNVTFKKAEKASRKVAEAKDLPFRGEKRD